MGKYATLQVFPCEFREDADMDTDGFAVAACRDKAEGEGYHPVGEPRIDWYEITQLEVEVELEAQRMAGIGDPEAPFRAGDWRVRVVIEVAEDAPLVT